MMPPPSFNLNLVAFSVLSVFLSSTTALPAFANDYYANGTGTSTDAIDSNNKGEISSSTFFFNVYGGSVSASDNNAFANNNELSVGIAEIEYAIYGGYALSYFDNAEANGNMVWATELNDVGRGIYGGVAEFASLNATSSRIFTASNNVVEVAHSSLKPYSSIAGGVVVTTSNGNVQNINVELKNNLVTTDQATGYYAIASEFGYQVPTPLSLTDTVSLVLEDNALAIKNESEFVRAVGALLNFDSSHTENIIVNRNSVEIDNSSISEYVAAVRLNADTKYKEISSNSVTLKDATVVGGVFGAVIGDDYLMSYQEVDSNNIVKASGRNYVGTIGGFKQLSLTVSENNKSVSADAESDKAVIVITGTDKKIDFANREIIVEAEDGVTLANNEVLNLITVSGVGSSVVLPEGFKISKGDTFKVTDYKILGDDMTFDTGETLAITVTDVTVPVDPEPTPPTDEEEGGEENNPDDGNSGDNADDGNNQGSWEVTTKPTDNAKTLAENYLGSAALIGLGTEYIADEGLAMIVDSAKLPGKNVFGAIYGGTGKYHTSSRLDLDSTTLITGVSAMTEKQKMALSAFVEVGWGDSEGHVNQAHAKADHNLYSMGTAMRFFTDSPLYFDASARLGVVRFDYTGNFTTESVKFEHSGLYAALHGAVGYAYPITEDTTLDSYLRYSFTYLEGGSEKLHNRSQDSFKMDSIRASAFRVGTRVKGYIGENQWLNYRVGAAYEKVVDGDANTKISGMSIDAPSLNGDTGIFEIGV